MAVFERILLSDDTYMPLITLLVYLIFWNQINRKEFLLFIYLVINVLFTAITNVTGFYKIHNLPLYHFYSLFEVAFVSYYLIKKFPVKTFKRNLYILINTGFVLFWLINILFLEPLTAFNSNTSSLSNMIILVLCMYYMLELSKSDDILNFQKSPSFWIVSAFFVYSATSILVFAVYKYYILSNMSAEGTKVYSIMHVPIIAKFIMLSVGLLCYKRPSSQRLLLL